MRLRRGYYVEICRHERDSGYTRAQQRGYSGVFCYVYTSCNIGRGERAWDTAGPGTSVELRPSVFEEDEVNDSPSPELGGAAARELRWLGETLVVRQGRNRGEQRQLDLDSAALFTKEALAMRSCRNGCQCPSCITIILEWIARTTHCYSAP